MTRTTGYATEEDIIYAMELIARLANACYRENVRQDATLAVLETVDRRLARIEAVLEGMTAAGE